MSEQRPPYPCPEHSGIVRALEDFDKSAERRFAQLNANLAELRTNDLHGLYERIKTVEIEQGEGRATAQFTLDAVRRIEAQMAEFAKRHEEEPPPALNGKDGVTRKELLVYIGIGVSFVMGLFNLLSGLLMGHLNKGR